MSFNKLQHIHDVIYPFFQPGFCEGVLKIYINNSAVNVIVNNKISKQKIEAILNSDFAEEKYLIRVIVE